MYAHSHFHFTEKAPSPARPPEAPSPKTPVSLFYVTNAMHIHTFSISGQVYPDFRTRPLSGQVYPDFRTRLLSGQVYPDKYIRTSGRDLYPDKYIQTSISGLQDETSIRTSISLSLSRFFYVTNAMHIHTFISD